MIEAGVLYADLHWEWRPLPDIRSLPRSGVLFILFRSDEGNVVSLAHHDWYGVKVEGDVIHVLEVFDEDGRAYVYGAGPRTAYAPKPGGRDLIPADWFIFEGRSVSPQEWEDALAAFAVEAQRGRG